MTPVGQCANCGRDVFWGSAALGLDPRSVYCVTEGCIAAALGIDLPPHQPESTIMHRITTPQADDASIENQIQLKGKTAPRVKPADLEAEIASEHYFTAADGQRGAGGTDVAGLRDPLSLLTFCVLVLKNGFTVTGESACASPENFDADIGRRLARAKAMDKLWPLLGFRLRDELSRGE